MAITQADFCELLNIAQKKNKRLHTKTDFADNILFPHSLGEGGQRTIYLRNGLELIIRNGKLRQALVVDHQHESDFPLVAKFYVSGFSRVKTKGAKLAQVGADYTEVAGCHYLYYLPDIAEVEEWPGDEPCQVIMICAQVDYLRAFQGADIPLGAPLKQLLEDHRRTQPFHKPLGRITPKMYQILHQILSSPYRGMLEHLLLESKVLELLALQFALLGGEDAPAAKQISFRAKDADRVQYAKELIEQQMCDPPSLAELAQLSGLNEFKLKQGFRHLFRTTVFGYLYDYRMAQAQNLLRNDYMNVAQVAAQVGYRSPEAFSTAFRRKFAVSPKAYQLGQRRY
ncbi:MAG: AraC family transcriptional regulator [Cyanobacteria bacterium J06649_4]